MNRIGWPTASELLQELAGDPSGSSSVQSDQLRWLGHYGLVEPLRNLVAKLRNSPHWGALLALEVSLAWLLAGDGHQADLAFLEADDLDPSLALVPDLWGLWPAPSKLKTPTPMKQRAVASDLAARIRRWRHLDPTPLEASWRQRAQADWTMALTSPGLEELILLLRHGSALAASIEPFLAELVAEQAMAARPAEALQFWGLLTELRPDWIHARIRAADLALACGDQQRSATWIATATEEVRGSPWYWDIAARAALDSGAVAAALEHWGQALAAAPPELAEVFRQRHHEARRGPALLQARSLLNRGDAAAALPLLQRLVADDPQWQPLRSLLLQAEAAEAAGPDADPAAGLPAQRFARFLEQAASRIGQSLPPCPPCRENLPKTSEAARQQLIDFSRILSDAEARHALET